MSTHSPQAPTRDIVVIGCSAGGIDALSKVLGKLPADLPAAVFIVQHLAPVENPYLVEILRRASALPLAWAEQGAPIAHRQVAVAPPGCSPRGH